MATATAPSSQEIEALAGRVHTPESFGRAVMGSVLQSAMKKGRKADAEGNITVPAGQFTIKRANHVAKEAEMRVWICWEDEGRQQSICVEVK